MQILSENAEVFCGYLNFSYGFEPIVHNNWEPNDKGEIARGMIGGAFVVIRICSPILSEVVFTGLDEAKRKSLEMGWANFLDPHPETE